MVMRNDSKFDLSISELQDGAGGYTSVATDSQETRKIGVRSELLVERYIVQEHIGVLIPLVEPVFHLLHALHDTLEITIPRQHDDSSIRAAVLNRRSIVVPDVFRRCNAF